jgi:hypothetical protein
MSFHLNFQASALSTGVLSRCSTSETELGSAQPWRPPL